MKNNWTQTLPLLAIYVLALAAWNLASAPAIHAADVRKAMQKLFKF